MARSEHKARINQIGLKKFLRRTDDEGGCSARSNLWATELCPRLAKLCILFGLRRIIDYRFLPYFFRGAKSRMDYNGDHPRARVGKLTGQDYRLRCGECQKLSWLQTHRCCVVNTTNVING